MPANSDLPNNPQRISFACACGKKHVAKSIKSGKRIKCGSCGQVVVVPPVGKGTMPKPSRATWKPHAKLKIALCALSLVVAIGGGAVVHFAARQRQQAPNGAAKAWIKAADDWDAERAAEAIFDAAKTKLNAAFLSGHLEDIAPFQVGMSQAVALLRQYVADPHATKKPEAQQLIAEYDLATSDKAALDTQMAMSSEQLRLFDFQRHLNDNKITHPKLAMLRIIE